MPQHERRHSFILATARRGIPRRGGPDGQPGPGGQWASVPCFRNRRGVGNSRPRRGS